MVHSVRGFRSRFHISFAIQNSNKFSEIRCQILQMPVITRDDRNNAEKYNEAVAVINAKSRELLTLQRKLPVILDSVSAASRQSLIPIPPKYWHAVMALTPLDGTLLFAAFDHKIKRNKVLTPFVCGIYYFHYVSTITLTACLYIPGIRACPECHGMTILKMKQDPMSLPL